MSFVQEKEYNRNYTYIYTHTHYIHPEKEHFPFPRPDSTFKKDLCRCNCDSLLRHIFQFKMETNEKAEPDG